MRLKNKTPLVTVIVPAYNEEKNLEKCLSTLKMQTYSHVQLIVIDDGSTDGSRKIAKKYADIFLSQKHQGPGVARNKAAKIAKGKILVFADADMYFDKNYVKMLVKPILEKNAFSSYTLDEYIANPQNFWVKCYKIDNGLKDNKKNVFSKDQHNYFRAIKKDFFLMSNGYDTRKGYVDDLIENEKINSYLATNAICYHNNPSNLFDVFISSRWIGRSPFYKLTVRNVFRYSIINSILNTCRKVMKGAPLGYFFYKSVFDFGILIGILFKNTKANYSK
ncbi:MAG TPA: glycosyltransferase family 2 protein [Patescibacteria group bacterium]